LLCLEITVGCKSSEKIKEPPAIVVYEFQCSGSDYIQTRDYYRVHKIGESVDQPTSMKKAIQKAQKELARSIKSTLNGAIENYFHTNRIIYDDLLRDRVILLTDIVGDESVQKVNIICEETIKTLNGLYRTYVVLELSVNEVLNELQKKASQNNQFQSNVNYSEFKKFLELEMNKSPNKPVN
jgi:hypothetical protein